MTQKIVHCIDRVQFEDLDGLYCMAGLAGLIYTQTKYAKYCYYREIQVQEVQTYGINKLLNKELEIMV